MFFTTAVSRDSEKLQLTNFDLDFTKFGTNWGVLSVSCHPRAHLDTVVAPHICHILTSTTCNR